MHNVTLRDSCFKTEMHAENCKGSAAFFGSNFEHLGYYLIATFVAPLNLL
jgi:hypothetical protein